jgi:hypothetical protein
MKKISMFIVFVALLIFFPIFSYEMDINNDEYGLYGMDECICDGMGTYNLSIKEVMVVKALKNPQGMAL